MSLLMHCDSVSENALVRIDVQNDFRGALECIHYLAGAFTHVHHFAPFLVRDITLDIHFCGEPGNPFRRFADLGITPDLDVMHRQLACFDVFDQVEIKAGSGGQEHQFNGAMSTFLEHADVAIWCPGAIALATVPM